MKKSILRLTFTCSVLLIALLLSACGGSATPATNNNDAWEQETATSQPSAIITNAQTALSVNPNSYEPEEVTSTFSEGSTVYVTFNVDLNGITPQDGYYGDIKVIYYNDGAVYWESTLNGSVDEGETLSENDVDPNDLTVIAYFFHTDYVATEEGKIELYWCATNGCSDPALAQTVNFTVTPANA